MTQSMERMTMICPCNEEGEANLYNINTLHRVMGARIAEPESKRRIAPAHILLDEVNSSLNVSVKMDRPQRDTE
jgi:hypothetical protein